VSRNAAYDASGRWSIPFEGAGEIIPACPPLRPAYVVQREPQALINPEPRGRLAVKYDETNGELTLILNADEFPSNANLNFLLAGERARHAVKRITFVISNKLDENRMLWFQKKGFERIPSEHTSGSMIAFSKLQPYTDPPVTSAVIDVVPNAVASEGTAEEKLKAAKASVRTMHAQ
jgi:hypothetical protein